MKRVTIYLLILLCGLSCEENTTEENRQDENDDISIRMAETIDGARRTLQLICLTKKEYPCSNYGIGTTYNKTADKIDLAFGDVIIPEICLTAFGPAQSIIDLGTLSNGAYQLNINSGKGNLVVSDESYTITFSESEQFEIVNSTLMRNQEEKDLRNENYDISIRMAETIDGAQRTLQFHCLTKEIYPCSNYGIGTTYNKTADKIDLAFGDVIIPEICLTAFGPAQSIIDLGTLSNGAYQLNINSGKGNLVVSDDSYTITFSESEQFEIVNSALMRIPSNTIWGTIGYHENSTSALVQTVIDSLQQLGAVQQKYKQGYYGEYEIDSNGQIVQPGENSGYYFAFSFIFHYSGDISALEKLVKYYGDNYGEDFLYLQIHTDMGEIYRSWIH